MSIEQALDNGWQVHQRPAQLTRRFDFSAYSDTRAFLDRLAELLAGRMPEAPPAFPPDVLTDRDEPFHAAEVIREKLTLNLREELHYGLSVQIERFADEDGRTVIHAVIWVERGGQKAIVIGQRGERLKEIGRLARIELVDLWQRPVHLELWVKVKENWADSEAALKQFGYEHT